MTSGEAHAGEWGRHREHGEYWSRFLSLNNTTKRRRDGKGYACSAHVKLARILQHSTVNTEYLLFRELFQSDFNARISSFLRTGHQSTFQKIQLNHGRHRQRNGFINFPRSCVEPWRYSSSGVATAAATSAATTATATAAATAATTEFGYQQMRLL